MMGGDDAMDFTGECMHVNSPASRSIWESCGLGMGLEYVSHWEWDWSTCHIGNGTGVHVTLGMGLEYNSGYSEAD